MSEGAPGHKRHALAALFLLGLAAAVPVLLAPGGGGKGAGAAIDRCAVPPELAALGAALPHTAARLLEGSGLTIVALGSSSTWGTGASAPEKTYPGRLAALLKARFPGLPIRVLNRGVGGEMSPQMLARLQRDVLVEKPDLVIWQLGTNSTLHDRDPRAEIAVAETGIARIKAANADVMLMDLQYAPAVLLHPTYGDMEVVLAGIARNEAVPLVRRFAMMRYWAENGRMGLDAMLAKDRLHMSDASYDCLARQVADGILAAETDEIAELVEE